MYHKMLDLRALTEFSAFLDGSHDKDIILIELVKLFDEVLGCSRVSAFLFENGNFELKAKSGEIIELDSPEILNESQKFINLFNCRNNTCEPVFLGNKELSTIPLMYNNEVYGLIVYKLPGLKPANKELVSLFGILASVALKNAALVNERKMLDGIVSTFSSGLDMHIYLPRFAGKLRQIFPFDRMTITIPDPFDKEALIVFAEDSNSNLRTRRVKSKGSAPSWVISTGKYIIEEDLSIQSSFSEDEKLLAEGIRCALRLPLCSKGRIIGTLNIGSKLPYIYKKRDIELFSEVANRIGPAVENSLVYETINEKLGHALIQLENNFSATLNALVVLLDSRDAGTKGHSLRVVRYAAAVAEKLGLTGKELDDVRLGSLLHDIGKIGIPDSILFKPGKLNDDEWVVMKSHPELGADMVTKVEFLSPATPIVLHHHEWFNGNGYPSKLAGEDIPLGARIFAIADAFDAMTSKRPYRDAQTIDFALEELNRCRGTQFCPDCLAAFVNIPSQNLMEIYDECQAEVTFKNPHLVGRDIIDAAVAHDLVHKKS